MFESDLLVLWLPARELPGSVASDVRKLGLTAVPGCEEPAAREWLREASGLVLSIVGWQGTWRDQRVVLPRPVHGLIDALVGAHPEGFEMVIWNDAPDLAAARAARRDALHGAFTAGVRYQVFP